MYNSCSTILSSHRLLDIEGANRYELTNLHYTITDLSRFAGKRVLISGGGDSAVDWANEMGKIASEVTVAHRRHEFTGHESPVAQMKAQSKVMTPYNISRLYGTGDKIDRVELAHVENARSHMLRWMKLS